MTGQGTLVSWVSYFVKPECTLLQCRHQCIKGESTLFSCQQSVYFLSVHNRIVCRSVRVYTTSCLKTVYLDSAYARPVFDKLYNCLKCTFRVVGFACTLGAVYNLSFHIRFQGVLVVCILSGRQTLQKDDNVKVPSLKNIFLVYENNGCFLLWTSLSHGIEYFLCIGVFQLFCTPMIWNLFLLCWNWTFLGYLSLLIFSWLCIGILHSFWYPCIIGLEYEV